jgi:sulfite reductase alpha subunit-like flavoprotein
MLGVITGNLVYIVTGFVGLLVAYFFFFSQSSGSSTKGSEQVKTEEEEEDNDTGNKQKLLILFGSQTGTAEEYAGTIAQESKRFGFKPKVVDLVDFEPVRNFCVKKFIGRVGGRRISHVYRCNLRRR